MLFKSLQEWFIWIHWVLVLMHHSRSIPRLAILEVQTTRAWASAVGPRWREIKDIDDNAQAVEVCPLGAPGRLLGSCGRMTRHSEKVTLCCSCTRAASGELQRICVISGRISQIDACSKACDALH